MGCLAIKNCFIYLVVKELTPLLQSMAHLIVNDFFLSYQPYLEFVQDIKSNYCINFHDYQNENEASNVHTSFSKVCPNDKELLYLT